MIVDTDRLLALISELSSAEAETMEVVGPITSRLHGVIDDLCNLVKIPNKWETQTDEDDRRWKTCPTCYSAIVGG